MREVIPVMGTPVFCRQTLEVPSRRVNDNDDHHAPAAMAEVSPPCRSMSDRDRGNNIASSAAVLVRFS
jgi:hypothetical protein